MPDINPTASYIRARHAANMNGEAEGPLVRRVWNLLATPQTVESLCRALERDSLSGGDCRPYVTTVLSGLYDRELIELSPDS